MTITGAHVERVLRSIPGAYGRQITNVDELAAGANEALAAAPTGLTQQGAAAFLATMSQESGSFRYLEEIRKDGRYAPYIGRTFEQITWRDNYRDFGIWCFERGLVSKASTFVADPHALADVRWAWLGGIWFWQANGIWPYANRGAFLATQRAVNLGNPNSSKTPAGITARRAWYAAWLTVGPDLIPGPIPTDPDTALSSERPISMATGTNVYLKFAGKQGLKSGDGTLGDNEVVINADGDKTLLSGPNKGVDLLATVDVRDATGRRLTPADGVETFFRVVSFKDKTPTTTISSRIGTTTDQASFKGSVSADKTAGRSARLRLVVHVPGGLTGITLAAVQISGWKL